MTDSCANPCHDCGLKALCIARGLDSAAEAALGSRLRQPRVMPDGHVLFWQGDSFHALYAVRSGAVKAVARDADGQERVRGFYLPGDVIGLDALDAEIYPASAETLGETRLCVLPHKALDELLCEVPAFTRRLVGLMSRELAHSLSLAGEYTADQRMAAFLLEISDRVARRTGQAKRITLEMSRADIANFLRLVPETVSRVLGRFAKQGLIEVHRRDVAILQRSALLELAAPLRDVCPTPNEGIRVAA